MKMAHKGLSEILDILKNNPRGMSVKQIAEAVGMNRISIARYMDILQTSGQVDMEPYGKAKVYFLSRRVPISALLNYSSDYVVILNPSQQIVRANTNFLRLFDLNQDDIEGSKLEDFLHPLTDDSEIGSKIEKAVNGEDVIEEICIRNKKQEEQCFRMKILPTVFIDGTPGITIILEDITENKKSIQALVENEQKYRSLVEGISELIFNIDMNFKLTYMSPRSLEILGFTPEEMTGKTPFEFRSPDCKPRLEEMVHNNTFLAGGNHVFETTLNHRNGHPVALEVSFTPVFFNGIISGYRGICHNITCRKKVEEINAAQRDLAWALSSATTFEEALPLCISTAVRVLDMDAGGIYLIDPVSNDFSLYYYTGISDEFLSAVAIIKKDSPRWSFMQAGTPIYNHYPTGLPAEDQSALDAEGIRSVAVIPIKYEEKVIASMNMGSHKNASISDFSRNELETIAASIGNVITRIKAQETLAYSEKKFRMLFNNADDAIYLYKIAEDGTPGQFIEVNDVACRRTGYSREELLSMTVIEINRQFAIPGLHEIMKKLNESGHVRFNTVHFGKEEQNVEVEVNSHLFTLNGKTVVLSIARNIGDRKNGTAI